MTAPPTNFDIQRTMNYQVRPIVTWPGQRTKLPKSAPFRSHWSETEQLLEDELRRIGAKNAVLQLSITERDIKVDGCLRGDARPGSPVIVSFDSKHGPISIPCDAFANWRDNVRAIALGLEALRKLERYGITGQGQQYTGWKALPPPASSQAGSSGQARPQHAPPPPPDPDGFRTREEAKAFQRTIVGGRVDFVPMDQVLRECEKLTHPDAYPGREAKFKRVQAARRVLVG
jgi:hypothetical protein